jgi:antitoxin (DNA-binding transcriptional repressor) of toxin-antitoxin stability system
MKQVEIRALRRSAAALVAEAASGETITITDRGRPVAQMNAIPVSRIAAMVRAGLARPAKRNIADLPAPKPGPNLSATLQEMRSEERY